MHTTLCGFPKTFRCAVFPPRFVPTSTAKDKHKRQHDDSSLISLTTLLPEGKQMNQAATVVVGLMIWWKCVERKKTLLIINKKHNVLCVSGRGACVCMCESTPCCTSAVFRDEGEQQVAYLPSLIHSFMSCLHIPLLLLHIMRCKKEYISSPYHPCRSNTRLALTHQ